MIYTIGFLLTTYDDEGIALFLRRSGGVNTWSEDPAEALFLDQEDKAGAKALAQQLTAQRRGKFEAPLVRVVLAGRTANGEIAW